MASALRTRFKSPAIAALVIVLAALSAFPVLADFSDRAWPFYKPILLPADLPETALVEVAPDTEVFSQSAPGLADLRVIDVGSQREVPYKLLLERGEQRRASVAVMMRNLGHVPGEYTTFILDLEKEGILHNEIEVRTPSKNFQRPVEVEGSEDGKDWKTLDRGGRISDLTIEERDFNTRYTRVRYPASTARYLRVRIADDGGEPLEVSGAVVYFTQQLPPQETELSAKITSRAEDEATRETKLFLDLGSAGFPANRISLATSQENFYRRVKLDGSGDSLTWTSLQDSESIYVFNTPKFVGGNLSINFPESRHRYFRLTILNEDNPPLPVTNATASGYLRKLIFSANPGQTYRLYYGNAVARPPSYELERVFPYLVTQNLPVAQLGAHTPNPPYAEPQEPFTERYPWLLPAVVALAALLIGLFLTSLFRQLKGMLPPPPTPQ